MARFEVTVWRLQDGEWLLADMLEADDARGAAAFAGGELGEGRRVEVRRPDGAVGEVGYGVPARCRVARPMAGTQDLLQWLEGGCT